MFGDWINLRTMLGAALALALGGCLTGCGPKATTIDEHATKVSTMLGALERSKFKGEFAYRGGGNLLGLNAKTNWSIGPENSILEIDGAVDFSAGPIAAASAPPGG